MKFADWFKKILIFLVLFFVVDYAVSALLLNGLNKYFGLHTQSDMFINGSSMSMSGFDKTNLENVLHKKISFYTRTGVSLQDRSAMLHHYFDSSSQKTDIAVFEVNPLLFSKKFTSANVYMLFLPFIDEPSMAEFIRTNTDTKEFWVRKLIRCSRYNSDMIALAIKGYTGNYKNQKNITLDVNALQGMMKETNSVPVELNPQKIKLFQETIGLMQKHCNKIILVNMPIFTTKLKTFKTQEYRAYLNLVQQSADASKNIYFLDLSQPNIDDQAAYFSDPLHLNSSGQEQITAAMTQFLSAHKF